MNAIIEQVQDVCDEFACACPECVGQTLPVHALHVVIQIGEQSFFDGPYCPHNAEQVREAVGKIDGVDKTTVAELEAAS